MLRFLILLCATSVFILEGCHEQQSLTPLGHQVLHALSQEDVALAYELSEKAIAAGEHDARVLYIAAAGNFFDGNLERCISLTRRINPQDSLYSRACVLRTSAALQINPDEAFSRGIRDTLRDALATETRAEFRSVLAEAQQLVYSIQRQRRCASTAPGEAGANALDAVSDSCLTCSAELLLAAYRGVQNDLISFPSWTVLSEFHVIAPNDSLSNLIYETAAACMNDDRITVMHATGMLAIAMTTAAERREVERLAMFARMYLAINGATENEVFIALTTLPPTASRAVCLRRMEDAFKTSQYLRTVMSYGHYPRILIPRVQQSDSPTGGTSTTNS